MIELTLEQQMNYRVMAKRLKGSERRIFMAHVVQSLGRGGQRYAEKTLGWNRRTVRKGMSELTSGVTKIDQFSARGPQRVDARLPHLMDDLRAIIESQGQVDASTACQQPQARLSAAAVRCRLIEQKEYCAEVLPCVATIRKKLKQLEQERSR